MLKGQRKKKMKVFKACVVKVILTQRLICI